MISYNSLNYDFPATGEATTNLTFEKCSIRQAGWSSSPDSLQKIIQVKQGQAVYVYMETVNCEGEEFTFELYRIKKRFILKDILVSEGTITKIVPRSGVLAGNFIVYVNSEDGTSSVYKFRVRLSKYLQPVNQTTNTTLPPPPTNTTNQTTNTTTPPATNPSGLIIRANITDLASGNLVMVGSCTFEFIDPCYLYPSMVSGRTYKIESTRNQGDYHVVTLTDSTNKIIQSITCTVSSIFNYCSFNVNNLPSSSSYKLLLGTKIYNQTNTTTTFECKDGIDNDGDGLIDYPNDPGCSFSEDVSEINPSSLCTGQNCPDLVPEAAYIRVFAQGPLAPNPGALIGYPTFSFRNIGNSEADNFYMGVKITRNGSTFSPFSSYGPYYLDALFSGKYGYKQTSAMVFPDLGDGKYCFEELIMDVTNTVGETNENNNKLNGGCVTISNGGYTTDVTNLVQCNDKADNDGDGLTDYSSDPGCETLEDPSE